MNQTEPDDRRWMAAALALAGRAQGSAAPNPAVGCLIVRAGRVIGRGWTQPGGRPHAEAMALAQAGKGAAGAVAYVTLEPCAHTSMRGPACADLLVAAGLSRVVTALVDPDPRTAGAGHARLQAAGLAVTTDVCAVEAAALNAGFLVRLTSGRPQVTLKLALSLDGGLALASGESRWLTGERARVHAHLLRSRHDAILVGSGTVLADDPALDVRLPGLGDRSPRPFILSRTWTTPPPGSRLAARDARVLRGSVAEALSELADLGVNRLMVEGGALVAAAFLAADCVDELWLYRAPLLLGAGRAGIGDLGLAHLPDAHGRWRKLSTQSLGVDTLEVYKRQRNPS